MEGGERGRAGVHETGCRMLPITKFYRAYPELNGYPDETCERMILAARARRGDAMWVVPLAAVLAVNSVVVALAFVAARVMSSAAAQPGARPPISIPGLWVGALVVMFFIGAWLWVAVRRVLIIRSVLLHMEKARCPYCHFSLRGLLVDYGRVVCPECGQQILLADEGLTPDDLRTHGRPILARPADPPVDLSALPLASDEPPRRKG